MLDSWLPSSRGQYESALNKWFLYCQNLGLDPFKASHMQAVEFHVDLFHKTTLRYSAMGTSRSALSSILQMENRHRFGKNPMVSRLLKGIFHRRPALPKYTVQWDVEVVFRFIMKRSSEGDNSLRFHVMKLAILLCILSSQRTQSLGKLKLEYMHLDNSRAILT